MNRELDKHEVADAFDRSTSTIRRWVRNGCPHGRGEKGRYLFHLGEVMDWAAEQGYIEDPGDEGEKDWDLMWRKERALHRRLKRRREAGELVEREKVQERRLRQIHAAKSILQSIPRSVAPELVGKERAEIETILENRINAALRELADADNTK